MSHSNLEKNFLLSLFAEKARPDGRSFDGMRDVELTFGREYGNVEVKLGRTRLIAQVSASVRNPRPERPFEGLFHISTDISSMASPQFENGRSTGTEEVLVARVIEKAIRRSNALDLENLCIIAGKKCWMIRADVHYLNYDGGLIDATCIGVIAALLHFRRPDTSINGSDVIIHSIDERPPVPLSVLHIPISITWSFIPLPRENSSTADDDDSGSDMDDDDGNTDGGVRSISSSKFIALLDATAAEQQLRTGEITISINKDREICQISKAGGAELSTATLMKFANHAHKLTTDITDLINRELKADTQRRNKGNIVPNMIEGDTALNER